MLKSCILAQIKTYNKKKGLKHSLIGNPSCIQKLEKFYKELKSEDDKHLTETEMFRLATLLNSTTPEKEHLSDTIFKTLRSEFGNESLTTFNLLCEAKLDSPELLTLILKIPARDKYDSNPHEQIYFLLRYFVKKLTEDLAKAILKRHDILEMNWGLNPKDGEAAILDIMSIFANNNFLTGANFDKIFQIFNWPAYFTLDHFVKGLNRLPSYKPEYLSLCLNNPKLAGKISHAARVLYNINLLGPALLDRISSSPVLLQNLEDLYVAIKPNVHVLHPPITELRRRCDLPQDIERKKLAIRIKEVILEYLEFPSFGKKLKENFICGKTQILDDEQTIIELNNAIDITIKQIKEDQMLALFMGLHPRLGSGTAENNNCPINRFLGSTGAIPNHAIGDRNLLFTIKEVFCGEKKVDNKKIVSTYIITNCKLT